MPRVHSAAVPDPQKPLPPDRQLQSGSELFERRWADPKRYAGALDQLGVGEGDKQAAGPRPAPPGKPPPPEGPGFDPRPPADQPLDGPEDEDRQPVGDADPEANEARNRAVLAIVAALVLAGLVLGGWMFTRGSNPGGSGNAPPTAAKSTPVASATVPPIKASFLELAGTTPLNGPIVVSTIYCSVPAYDPNSYEIDADATIGGTKVLLTALTSGSALGLPASNSYFDIHTDLTKSASDATGWVSNEGIAIFAGHSSVTIDGRLLAGPVAGGADVGRIDSTTLTCPR
jgi:hypothetical protein